MKKSTGLLETQSMGIHDILQGLQRIIGPLYTGNIFQITEVVREWRGLFFVATQKDEAI